MPLIQTEKERKYTHIMTLQSSSIHVKISRIENETRSSHNNLKLERRRENFHDKNGRDVVKNGKFPNIFPKLFFSKKLNSI